MASQGLTHCGTMFDGGGVWSHFHCLNTAFSLLIHRLNLGVGLGVRGKQLWAEGTVTAKALLLWMHTRRLPGSARPPHHGGASEGSTGNPVGWREAAGRAPQGVCCHPCRSSAELPGRHVPGHGPAPLRSECKCVHRFVSTRYTGLGVVGWKI